uniref:Leucine-rich repeat-containing N-terminal plant-type domain-containing protein n=1 Tax=Salix viminalis TaxID=40686 RepID=A0A6N2LFX1_SALVM
MYKLTCSPIFSCLRSLIVNRLTGTIPPEIGNITTLEQLVLEDNLLGGSLPPDLGNLTRLRRLADEWCFTKGLPCKQNPELKILQNISDKLNISDWATIDRTSCDKAEWNLTIDDETHSIVQCNCTFENDSVCHVTNISVTGFNLNGVLPEELGDLPELLEIG